jgi:hypothetical protein
MKTICSNEINENDFFEWVEWRRLFQMSWIEITFSNKLNRNHFFKWVQMSWMKTSSSNENDLSSFQSTARRTRVISQKSMKVRLLRKGLVLTTLFIRS